MLASILLASTIYQTPAQSFSAPFAVAETQRLAITPKIDGTLSPEEWDELGDQEGVQSYFQWEPRQLHVAAKIPNGKDMLVSLDLKPNGWLIGRENLEVRISMAGGTPKIMVRQLDATQTAGPKWIDLPGFAVSSRAAGSATGDSTVIELTLIDPGLGMFNDAPGGSLAVRVDAVATDAAQTEPFLPRSLTTLKLGRERATALPVGLRATAEGPMRFVLPGDSTKVRLTFNGTNELGLRKMRARTEGFGSDATNKMESPFPMFDKKKRAFVDYETRVDRVAEPGYRVLHTDLVFEQGPEAALETTFRIAPLVDFELAPTELAATTGVQKIKLKYFIRSNAPRKVEAQYKLDAPEGFTIKNGSGGGVTIYDGRGMANRTVEMEVPANASGTFPLKFTVYFGDKQLQQTVWFTIF